MQAHKTLAVENWFIWQFMTDVLKFNLSTSFILTDLLCIAANLPMLLLPECLWTAICQSLVLYMVVLKCVTGIFYHKVKVCVCVCVCACFFLVITHYHKS